MRGNNENEKARKLRYGDQEPGLTQNLKIAGLFGKIRQHYGVSAAAVAIAWTLRLSAVTETTVGARRPVQIDGIIGAGYFRLTKDEIEEIEKNLTGIFGTDAQA